MSYIETFSGERFKPLAPVFADIHICDIAHALAQQCRFGGHTRVPYSVAEHSVRVAEFMLGLPNRTTLWGLLHDASEAYLVDLPTPLKMQRRIGQEYRRAESRVMSAVRRRFGLVGAEPKEVRIADEVLLATEVRDLMPGLPEHWGRLAAKPMVERIRPWSSATAEYEFLRLFEILSGSKR